MKFRASFSVLSAWQSGNYDRATEMYFKLKKFATPAMVEGKRLHKEWKKEVDITKCLPKVFGGKKLNNPHTEVKLVKQLDDWLELVGVVDLEDLPTLADYKTGVTPSETYANSMQLKVYQILFPTATKAEIYHYNQHTKETDMSIVHLNDKTLEESINWVVTLSGEMHDHFEKNGLYERFK